MKKVFNALTEVFDESAMYLGYIPLYPAGMWSFAYASKGIRANDSEVLARVEQGLETFGNSLKYYNKDMHSASFALPNFVAEIIR